MLYVPLPNRMLFNAISAAAKDAKRAVRSGERDIDKEIRNLERNEKSLVTEIKKTAKGGNQARCFCHS